MISKIIAIGFLGAAVVAGAASAQTTAPKDQPNTTANAHKEGEWRTSKVIGINVYNEANEKIGDIEDIIIDKSAKVAKVILGVGGFLGLGERFVAVRMDELKWVNEPIRTTTTAPVNTPTVATTDNGAVTGVVNRFNRPMRAANEVWYPDHAVYNASKEQLKAMPEFRYKLP